MFCDIRHYDLTIYDLNQILKELRFVILAPKGGFARTKSKPSVCDNESFSVSKSSNEFDAKNIRFSVCFQKQFHLGNSGNAFIYFQTKKIV